MEHKQSPSKKKLISIQEEKLIRKVDYDSIGRARSPPKKHILDLEILQKSPSPRKPSQRVLVSIKPRGPVPIRTIYIAEKNRHHSKKGLEKSTTRLAIGDHSSFTTHCSEDNSSSASPEYGESKNQEVHDQEVYILSDTDQAGSELDSQPPQDNIYNANLGKSEKCYIYAQPRIPLVNHKLYRKPEIAAYMRDVATYIATTPPQETINRPTITIVNNLNRRIDLLERKILKQEMVFRTLDPHTNQTTSNDESEDNAIRSTSSHDRAGSSYIEQYSHIPETSAFQRHAQQPEPLSPSKATTIEKEHNSEQYGRDFTAYDGITARGRRQCASVPCRRNDIPKMAAERVHKIRHKLNPVRDYRLMDTVHYLAQGEFAPRDDGIKLTPSREAVLSDIIWEDVCRTHWPTARLGRRERCNTRGELQRLIDCLLRERVAHVERRRRRHYRIVKLNHRHESCRPVGKTGDIIVASHKNKQPPDENEMTVSEHNTASAMISHRKWQEHSPQRSHRSHDRLSSPEPSPQRSARPDDCAPGPSCARPRAPGHWAPTCCYRASSPDKTHQPARSDRKEKLTSTSSGSTGKPQNRNPRLVVKKDPSHKKYRSREEPNLEHFILLPTLVIRTPSNVKRQKKFNELYHRILNVQVNKVLGVVSAAQLRQLARGGDGGLERAVLAGQGRRLLAEADPIPLPSHLVALVEKCEALHEAVEKGSLLELQELLEGDYNRRKVVLCCDEAGVGLLHKAVFYDYADITGWLVDNYPQLVHQKDSFGRTPLHYAAASRHAAAAAARLERAGAARGARDAAGRTPASYRRRTSLQLPAAVTAPPQPPGLVIKRHNIRIWCHDCDMARLQRVVWEGHGARLLSEVSNQPVVKKFLEAVPYLMNTIRDIHEAVVQNDLEGLMKHSGDPVTPLALSSRDVNNMTALHKAAGLGHVSIMKYIAERYPQGINDVDNDGRTPLHYAAIVRDEQHTYNTLVGLGADEAAVDNKNKTPGYYINRPQEIDKNVLKTVPDAPRTASSAYPSSWDWKLLDTEVIAELNKKSRRKIKASTENLSSKNNTNTVSESIENKVGAMKTSSTHEFIKHLPELDDNVKQNHNGDNKTGNIIEDSQVVEDEDGNDDKDKTKESDAEPKAQEETTEHQLEEREQTENKPGDTEDQPAEETVDDSRNSQDDEKHRENDDIDHDKDKHTEEHEIVNDEENISKLNVENSERQHDNNNTDEPEDDGTVDHKLDYITTGEEHAEHSGDTASHEQANSKLSNRNNLQDEPDYENTELEKSPVKDDDSSNITQEENNKNKKNIAEIEQIHHEDDDDIDENATKADRNLEEDLNSTTVTNEGNNNNAKNEDDDDVQVQGDGYSEYSDTNLRSTAEPPDTNSAKRGNQTGGRSTQESLIEGIISGEAELDSQDASITQKEGSVHGNELVVDSEIDPEVTDLINSANMEMLAALVLNGEGSRLIGRRSGNSELQAFLDNVSTYMQKIKKVHIAAKEGNIRELQAALDRRKFAIARDSISPNGATPLHVATVFGKTNIMKYLGGRFPETLSAVDFEGRTALHYAAVLPDNGHYYNLLQQLGANAKDLDDNGRSSEDYYKNPSLLPFDQLIADFGISQEAAQEMLSDKGTDHVANGHMDIPIFRTDEGRYLAKCKLSHYSVDGKMEEVKSKGVYTDTVFAALGDPLIKGLTEVANVKPKDPVAFLASFLHNFPDNEKPRLSTQESNVLVTQEAPEVENEQPPDILEKAALTRSATRTATRPRPIDVIAVDPRYESSPDAPEAAFSSADRDEHGQSMLHFAAARTHTRNALFQLLQESDVNLAFRDELYRTARDVSLQANVPENTAEIDRWVLQLAARGNKEKIMELFLEGYDHIMDVVDDKGVAITEVVANRGDTEMSNVLASIPAFEESRDSLHMAIRRGDLATVDTTVAAEGGRTLARAKNSFGRTALHIAVLAQHEEIVALLSSKFPELLRFGDNLERSPLHYAMGMEKMESLSRVLIRAGAKRVLKDLKGRQPSYYFMNKSDILRLKEEEEVY